MAKTRSIRDPGKRFLEFLDGDTYPCVGARSALSRGSLEKVHAVILETDGSFSVIQPDKGGSGSSLVGVEAPDEPDGR